MANRETLLASDRKKEVYDNGDTILLKSGDYITLSTSYKHNNRIYWEAGLVEGQVARSTTITNAEIRRVLREKIAIVIKREVSDEDHRRLYAEFVTIK